MEARGKIEAKIVVGADGSSSTVARTAGFDITGYKTLASFRYKYRNAKVDENEALFILSRDIGRGYLWVYPRGGSQVNVGVGGIDALKATNFFKKYVKDTKELKESQIYHRGGNLIPYSGLLPQIVKGNTALVGDSAGQVNSLLGGGIGSSLHAAKFLSNYIILSLEKGVSLLKNYDKDYRKTEFYRKYVGQVNRRLELVLRIYENENAFDIFDDVIKTISTKELAKFSGGDFGYLEGFIYGLKNPMTILKLLKLYRKYR